LRRREPGVSQEPDRSQATKGQRRISTGEVGIASDQVDALRETHPAAQDHGFAAFPVRSEAVAWNDARDLSLAAFAAV
jgi:hypothetical protein